MTLRIVKPSEPMHIANIVITVYSVPGLGKDSLAYTADDPLLLDFDQGSHRAALRRGDTVPIKKWTDVEEITAADIAPYKTVIISTGGRAGDLLKVHLIAADPKNSGSYGGMSGKGWSAMAGRLNRLVNLIRSEGKDLVVSMHCDEKGDGDDIKERIDAQGAWKNEIYKVSDAMCRIRIRPNGERYLDFDPSESGFGKNPAGLPKLAFPHPAKNPNFLAQVIAQIKGSINRITEAQAESVAKAEEEQKLWTKLFAEAATLESFNDVPLGLAKERKGTPYANALKTEAVRRGYKFNAATGLYEAANAIPAPQPTATPEPAPTAEKPKRGKKAAETPAPQPEAPPEQQALPTTGSIPNWTDLG